MELDKETSRRLEEYQRRTQSRGFTKEYQDRFEKEENVVCHKPLAPITYAKHEAAALYWTLFKLSRGEASGAKLSKDTPLPTPQELKNFVESFVASRKDLPSQSSTVNIFSNFVAKWHRETFQEIPAQVKADVRNFIKTTLTRKYNLPTKPRDAFHVNHKDIQYLLQRLFVDDWHDYLHERMRVQTASALSLFAGSGARVGAIVESSSYRGTNECLYYKHIKLHMKWSDDRKILIRWVSVDSEFLKGWRYRDDAKLPMNWFNEHPVLGLNFVFWVIVHGVADGAFKNLASLDDVLAVRPPTHRTSFTLEWKEQCLRQPFFRMVKKNGPDPINGLTFSSLRHHFTSLAERDGFRDKLRVHGIRGGVANRLDPNASKAARGQALDHQNPNTFLKYQAQLKTVDIQAAFCGFEPNTEGRDMQQSMEHHRDSNAPLRLNASQRIEFEADPAVIKMNERIRALTQEIDGKPDQHPNLCKERSTLYGRKAKLRRSYQDKLVKEWWSSSYDEYTSGNDFSEQDTTSLFDIYRKYIPERDRLSKSLFENTPIDSDIGRQCLADLIAICTPTERVVYYPGLHPVDGQCPLCSQPMSRCRATYLIMKPLVLPDKSISFPQRAKHILQCQRKLHNAAPYQQVYKNNKRAHRRVNHSYVQFCYPCAELIYDHEEWKSHCESHLNNLSLRCGMLTYRSTLIFPGFCPFCLGDDSKGSDERFKQWLSKPTLLNHIDEHLNSHEHLALINCPHPRCGLKSYNGTIHLQRHLLDTHSLDEPRPNCVSRKRRWGAIEKEDDSFILRDEK